MSVYSTIMSLASESLHECFHNYDDSCPDQSKMKVDES